MARIYGRTYDNNGKPTWAVVETDANGNNEYVYVTWLIQVLKLVLNESPFYANYGIPAVQSVIQQIFPDYYVSVVQQQFQQYFASLIISKEPSTTPTYNVQILFFSGTTYQMVVDADNSQTTVGPPPPVSNPGQLDISFILDESTLS